MKTFPMVLSFALLVGAACAKADDIQIVGEYNGLESAPYPNLSVVGSFNILPRDTGITISGTFGNSVIHSSSGVDLYLGSVLVAQCVYLSTCNHITTPWSNSLGAQQIASLGTGRVDLTAVQTSFFTVRLGETTLRQVSEAATAVPEPSALALLGTGLVAWIGVHRRKMSSWRV